MTVGEMKKILEKYDDTVQMVLYIPIDPTEFDGEATGEFCGLDNLTVSDGWLPSNILAISADNCVMC